MADLTRSLLELRTDSLTKPISSQKGGGHTAKASTMTGPTKDFKVAIAAWDLGGIGDLAGAKKIQDYVRRVFKDRIVPENIQIFMNTDQKKASLFPGAVFHPESEAREFQPDMVISFPGRMDQNHRFQQEHLARRAPTLYWSEYGTDPCMDFEYEVDGNIVEERCELMMSGLNEPEVKEDQVTQAAQAPKEPEEEPHSHSLTQQGIFLDKELVDWSSKERRANQRLSQLRSCSQGLQSAILGQRCSRGAISRFSSTQRLYTGYANTEMCSVGEGSPSAVRYLLGLASMNREMVDPKKESLCAKVHRVIMKRDTTKKDMTVVLMGNHDLTTYDSSDSYDSYDSYEEVYSAGTLKNPNVKKHLHECGINEVEILKYNKETGELEEVETIKTSENSFLMPQQRAQREREEGYKRMRIITGNIPHSEAIQLMKASEDETIATGDGSLAEAISGRKSFMYQQRRFKTGLGEGLKQRYEGIPITRSREKPRFNSDGELSNDELGKYFIKNRNSKEHRELAADVITNFDIEQKSRPKLEAYVGKLQEEKRVHGATIGYEESKNDSRDRPFW